MGEILLGCSGWHYKDWVGPFYKNDEESKLTAYSRVFKTAEIDSTFYAYPTKGMVFGWLKYTKPNFVFTAKLPKLITHKKKLDLKLGIEEDISRFCELMKPLQLEGKLGCLLAQLPPSLKCNITTLETFLSILPSNFRYALEFRDNSWLNTQTWKLMEKYEVAYTIVDEPLLPPTVKVTTNIAYMRWHGRGKRPWYNYCYKPEELKPWISKTKEVANQVKTVYGYFNNHFQGYAVKNCLEFLEKLGEITSEQAEAKKTVDEYFEARELEKTQPIEKKMTALTTYMPEKPFENNFDELFHLFINNGRIRRAKAIKDKEITTLEVSDNNVKALIREYHVLIDMQRKLVLHDCADWSRSAPLKQFCKHLGKVMLTIPKEKAIHIMRKIISERDKWEFKPYTSEKEMEKCS